MVVWTSHTLSFGYSENGRSSPGFGKSKCRSDTSPGECYGTKYLWLVVGCTSRSPLTGDVSPRPSPTPSFVDLVFRPRTTSVQRFRRSLSPFLYNDGESRRTGEEGWRSDYHPSVDWVISPSEFVIPSSVNAPCTSFDQRCTV